MLGIGWLRPHYVAAVVAVGLTVAFLVPPGSAVVAAHPSDILLASASAAQSACALAPARGLPSLQQHEGPTDYTLFVRPMGQLRSLMLFVDFSDVPQSERTVDLYERLAPQTAQWYQEASYGIMSLDFTAMHRWYRMPKPSRDYGFALEWPMAQKRPFVEDAVRSADRDIDFRGYHIIYIVTPRGTPRFRATTWFLLQPGRGIRADGTELRHAILVWGTEGRWSHLVHNTAHLFGLPDLYDRELLFAPLPQRAASVYVGGWDVMGWNEMVAHFFAWHKWKLGWLGPDEVVCLEAGTVEETLTPLAIPGGVKAIAVPTGPSTAYVVEARQPIGNDSRLCDQGVLVYVVDATVGSGAAPGPIRLVSAQSGHGPAQIATCSHFYNAPFDLGEGEVATFEDPGTGLTVEVLERLDEGYRVRVTKR